MDDEAPMYRGLLPTTKSMLRRLAALLLMAGLASLVGCNSSDVHSSRVSQAFANYSDAHKLASLQDQRTTVVVVSLGAEKLDLTRLRVPAGFVRLEPDESNGSTIAGATSAAYLSAGDDARSCGGAYIMRLTNRDAFLAVYPRLTSSVSASGTGDIVLFADLC